MAIRNPVTGADPLPGFRVRALRRAPRNDQFVYYHAGLATTGLAPCFEIGATPKKSAPCHWPTAQIFLLRPFSNFTLPMMVSKLPVMISLWCWMYHLMPGSEASEPPMPMIPSAPAANLPLYIGNAVPTPTKKTLGLKPSTLEVSVIAKVSGG